MKSFYVYLLASFILCIVGCDETNPTKPPIPISPDPKTPIITNPPISPPEITNNYFPLQEGNKWTYSFARTYAKPNYSYSFNGIIEIEIKTITPTQVEMTELINGEETIKEKNLVITTTKNTIKSAKPFRFNIKNDSLVFDFHFSPDANQFSPKTQTNRVYFTGPNATHYFQYFKELKEPVTSGISHISTNADTLDCTYVRFYSRTFIQQVKDRGVVRVYRSSISGGSQFQNIYENLMLISFKRGSIQQK